jgi:hypothetical protein
MFLDVDKLNSSCGTLLLIIFISNGSQNRLGERQGGLLVQQMVGETD